MTPKRPQKDPKKTQRDPKRPQKDTKRHKRPQKDTKRPQNKYISQGQRYKSTLQSSTITADLLLYGLKLIKA
jgi:hypothetical protein